MSVYLFCKTLETLSSENFRKVSNKIHLDPVFFRKGENK